MNEQKLLAFRKWDGAIKCPIFLKKIDSGWENLKQTENKKERKEKSTAENIAIHVHNYASRLRTNEYHGTILHQLSGCKIVFKST